MVLQEFDAQFLARLRTAVAAQVPGYLPDQRWFGSKARRIQAVEISDCVPLPLSHSVALIVFAAVEYDDGPGETYVIPLVAPPNDQDCPPESIVVRLPVSDRASEQPFVDALGDREFLSAIFKAIATSQSFAAEKGSVVATPEHPVGEEALGLPDSFAPRTLKGEQSNTSVVYGDRYILKFFRRLESGVHPDVEIGRFLTSVTHFPNVPPYCGSLNYESHDLKIITLGILQGFVPNQGDAWRFTVDSLAALFTRPKHPTGERDKKSTQLNAHSSDSSDRFDALLRPIALLGKRTAELHLALASSSADPDFAPEPFSPAVRGELDRAFHDLTVRNFEMLRLKTADLPEPVAELAGRVLKLEDEALLILHSMLRRDFDNLILTRIHGDYHLGQVLFTGSDFFIIDFEGEPARPLSERRNKRCPLQDVAGMLRSFHYAAHSACLTAVNALDPSENKDSNSEAQIARFAEDWQTFASREFLRSYRQTAGDAKFLPPNEADFDALLKAFLLEKAIYELGYELNNRPAWLAIPLEGIQELLSASV